MVHKPISVSQQIMELRYLRFKKVNRHKIHYFNKTQTNILFVNIQITKHDNKLTLILQSSTQRVLIKIKYIVSTSTCPYFSTCNKKLPISSNNWKFCYANKLAMHNTFLEKTWLTLIFYWIIQLIIKSLKYLQYCTRKYFNTPQTCWKLCTNWKTNNINYYTQGTICVA